MNDFQQQRDDAELVGCKLAYEAGVHWLDANVRALEALRTRSLALVSVMLIAATFVADFATGAAKRHGMGAWGWSGLALFALGMVVTIVIGVRIAWPVTFKAELGPKKIIENHVTPILTWPSASVYKAIANDLDGYANESREILGRRARYYIWSLIAAPVGVLGLGLLWADVNF